ncbi:MAG: helix-turn-helix domain-containing protein [Rhodocyclaceae bacterium]|nr:helix-turn-helix domain-containing protein [Rhodocyclaceae bacterium]
MGRVQFRLSSKDRELIEQVRSKGMHHAREVNRAHILAALDRGMPQAVIEEVLGVDRTAIWRTRTAYLDGGVQAALYDAPRPGRPPRYDANAEARVTALACSAPPEGAKRWTVLRLEKAARAEPGLEGISRETIRRLLKKTGSNLGGV